MPYLKRIVALGCVALAACDGRAGLQATTGDESGSSSTGTDTGDEPTDFSCAGARWTVVEPKSDDIAAVAVDSRGHARFAAAILPRDYRVLDLDAAGAIASDFRLPTDPSFIRFAGLDGEGNMLLDIRDREGDDPRQWLRKYDVSGALLWETDLGPYPDTNLLGLPRVAADGSTVLGVQLVSAAELTLRKYDAAGALTWEIPDDSYQSVQAVNAAGFIVMVEPTGSRVRVRTPDGETLWERSWDVPAIESAHIDAAGHVVAMSPVNKLVRYAPDGELLWETTADALPIPLSHIRHMAVNPAGEIAITGSRMGATGDVAFKLSPAGELAGDFTCDRMTIHRVAIDEAGALYLGGYRFRNGAYDAVMTAFD